MNWTTYQNMTKKQTKRLFKLVDLLIKGKEQGKQELASYKIMLNTLKNDFPQDAQDFIEYYNL